MTIIQDIFIGDKGKGLPLVFVHGFLGSTDMWKPQIEYFKKNYNVLTPALPGFGKSNNIQSCDSIKCMAMAVLNILKKKRIKKFNLLGHSMGGMIVQEIAMIAGDQISRLICYGTGPMGDIPGRFETINESKKKLKIDGLATTANRIAKTWFVDGDKAKYFYLCSNAGKETSLLATEKALDAMKNWNGINNLKNIKNKTLIIRGDKDKAYNFNQVKILRDNIPDSDLKIVKGSSHNVHLEKIGEFNSCVGNFLK